MDDIQREARPQTPLEKHARIESDLFCRHCDYNLYTQPVVRDERLGILVVRCPECGRFESATMASNAARVWLQRLASILLVWWAVILLAIVGLGTFALGGLQVAHIEIFTTGAYVDDQGRLVRREWDSQTNTMRWYTVDGREATHLDFSKNPEWRRTFTSMRHLTSTFADETIGVTLVAVLLLLAPTVFGGLLATLMWHVPRGRTWLFLLLPFIAAGFLVAIYHVDESERSPLYDVSVVAIVVGLTALEQAAFMLLGTRIGRPVARFLLTLFIPPRPRLALAFLWSIDGKPVPVPPQRP